jgi:hypothetical protein
VRVLYNWRDNYYDRLDSITRGTAIWTKGQPSLDAAIRYRFNDNFSLELQAVNLLDSPEETSRASSSISTVTISTASAIPSGSASSCKPRRPRASAAFFDEQRKWRARRFASIVVAVVGLVGSSAGE